MKTKSKKTKLRFEDMPKEYTALVAMFMPRPIHDEVDYDNVCEVADAMTLYHEDFTDDQEDYFDLLCTLIERYDEEHVTWPEVTGLQSLKHILEEQKMTGADLSRILGASAKLGPMILRGDRKITADHARTLGKRFCMEPGLFL